MQVEEQPVELELKFSNSLSDVWAAITDPAQMRQWFFAEMEEFEAKEGFATEFTIEHDGREFPHHWKVTKVQPQAHLEVEWRYKGFPGAANLLWVLKEVPDGTLLSIKHSALENFPKDDEVFSRESCLAGWDYLLNESLADYLAPNQEDSAQ